MPALRTPMMVLPLTVDPPECVSLIPMTVLSARLSRKRLFHPKDEMNPVRKAAEASLRYTRLPTDGSIIFGSPASRRPKLDALRSLSTIVLESLASRTGGAAEPQSAAGTWDSHRRVWSARFRTMTLPAERQR